jgi:hypothetical protein
MNASIEKQIAVNSIEKQILVNNAVFLEAMARNQDLEKSNAEKLIEDEAEDKVLTRLAELEMKMELTTITLKATMARIQELEESNAELMEDMTPAERYKLKMEKRRRDHEDEMMRKRKQHPDDMRRAMGWLESEWQVLEEHNMPHVVYYHVESDEQRFDLPDGHILCEDGLIWDTNYDQH